MRRLKIILLLLGMLFCFVSCQSKRQERILLDPITEQENTQISEETICVHVCGAVQTEGVYELPIGSRVYEAIELAGGFREDAAKTEVNQARVLEDEEKVYVPTVAEIQNQESKSNGKVNINKASKEELMTLPGVGEAKAESILQYRKERGSFQSIEEIMQISGIKEGLFQKIKDLIKI